MADTIIVGGGVVGMGLGMMLARDGHTVTVLERDPEPPPPSPDEALGRWERTGVNQFRLPHLFLPRYREILERSCPRLWRPSLPTAASASTSSRGAPEAYHRRAAPDDERFDMLSGRRAVVERAVASVAEEAPGLTVRRGVAVRELAQRARGRVRGAARDRRAHLGRRGVVGRPGGRLQRPPVGRSRLAGSARGAAAR